MNNRKHTRLPVQVTAELLFDDLQLYRGTTQNISFGGAYIQLASHHDVPPANFCQMTLVLREEPERTAIQIKCEVVHADSNGVGLRIHAINIDGYKDFKQLMISHTPAPDVLLEELRNNPNPSLNKG